MAVRAEIRKGRRRERAPIKARLEEEPAFRKGVLVHLVLAYIRASSGGIQRSNLRAGGEGSQIADRRGQCVRVEDRCAVGDEVLRLRRMPLRARRCRWRTRGRTLSRRSCGQWFHHL